MRRPRLSREHKQMLLEESSINPRLVIGRGYRTVTMKSELESKGFGRAQRTVPSLLIPIYGPTGEIALYQSRPDEPRIKNGKPIKYETPVGSRMKMDVHPAARDRLGDPSAPLFITEGIKKGDSLLSRGLCSISLIGVWSWRGTNEAGGKTALPEWESVALNGRQVYIVFDSDVMLKREVYGALVRLKGFLESRGAKVALIYLPAGESGQKTGADDYLAAGHTTDELLALATHELKSPPREEAPERSCPYREAPGGLMWDKPTQNGFVPTPLTNFNAKIVADVAEDDGAEERRVFEIEATLNGHVFRFFVPSSQFAGMGWATEHLGATAIVYPGQGTKDHARAAIQILSDDVPVRRVYAHTGWRKVGEEWVFLHAGGAVRAGGELLGQENLTNGQVGKHESDHEKRDRYGENSPGGQFGQVLPHVETSLCGLGGRTLPEPPEADVLIGAVRASLRLPGLVPDGIAFPMLAAVYRAALGDSDFSLHVAGPTGEGKSEVAALHQQHYGAGLDARNLTSWESTENAIEGQAFILKDMVLVLDDFAPAGTTHDLQRWHKKADRVLRAKGNASGRQRMRPDTTLRPEKPPRALILSTGEDVPRGQSLRARMLVLEMGPGELDWERLTDCQRDAAEGLYAQAMAGFVRWLAPRYEEVRSGLRAEHGALREDARRSDQHRRTAGIVADLALGLRYFLIFACEVGALTGEQAEEVWARGWRALGEAAAAQGQHQVASEPTQRFRELLSAAIASGQAHVAGPDGGIPDPKENLPEAWGWAGKVKATSDGDADIEYRHQGDRVGWIDGEHLYLEPEASFAAAQKQGRDSGEALAISGRTLRKRLHERGLLASTGKAKGRETLAVRRELGGKRRSVLHFSTHFLSPHVEKPDQPDHDDEDPDTYADSTPNLWSGRGKKPDHEPDQESGVGRDGQAPKHEPDQREPNTYTENPANGQAGPVFDEGGEENGGGGGDAHRTRRVREAFDTPESDAAKSLSLFLRGGEMTNLQDLTKSVLHVLGEPSEGWQEWLGPVFEEAERRWEQVMEPSLRSE